MEKKYKPSHPLIYHSSIRVRVCGSGEELGTGNEFGEDGYGVWGCGGSGGVLDAKPRGDE